MPLTPDDVYVQRTKNIARNLGKELERMAAQAPWREAAKCVALLDAAQVVYAVEDVAPAESKEAKMLQAAATRFERLLRRTRDRLVKEHPHMTHDMRARLDAEIEVVQRYTHALNAEARIALALRDAFDDANVACPAQPKIPVSLAPDGPLIMLTCAALEYTPVKDKTPQALCKALEKWPVLRRRERPA